MRLKCRTESSTVSRSQLCPSALGPVSANGVIGVATSYRAVRINWYLQVPSFHTAHRWMLVMLRRLHTTERAWGLEEVSLPVSLSKSESSSYGLVWWPALRKDADPYQDRGKVFELCTCSLARVPWPPGKNSWISWKFNLSWYNLCWISGRIVTSRSKPD